MTTSRREYDLIFQIVDRAEAMYKRLDITMPSSRQGLVMDIEFTHDIVPLALDEWLKADRSNFAHDVGGILTHFNRVTRELDDGFMPRFAACYFDQGVAQ